MPDKKGPRTSLHLVQKPKRSMNPELEHWLNQARDPNAIISRVRENLAHFLSYIGVFDNKHNVHRGTVTESDLPEVTQAITVTLHKQGAILLTAKLDLDTVRYHARAMGINLALENFMQYTSHPELPHENFERHLYELVSLIGKATVSQASSESLFTGLYEDKLFAVEHEDMLRYLLYLVNKDRLWPHVLVLPNKHKPYNPGLTLYYDNTSELSSMLQTRMLPQGLPADIRRLFRIFDR
jgi:hypothetical protein